MTNKQYKKIKNAQFQIDNRWKQSNPIHLIINRNSWGGGLNTLQKEGLLFYLKKQRRLKSELSKYLLRENFIRLFGNDFIDIYKNKDSHFRPLYINKNPILNIIKNELSYCPF